MGRERDLRERERDGITEVELKIKVTATGLL